MPSFKTSIALIAGSLFLGAHAQLSYPINITAVPLDIRQQWCESQLTACPLLCDQNNGTGATTVSNNCDPTTLVFNCVCGNGLSPNASEYSQTIPYFECQEYGNECVAACDGLQSCQSDCRNNNPCGAQNPTRVNLTSSSSTSGATGSPTSSGPAVFNGFGGSSSSSSSSSSKKGGAQAAVDVGRSYGLAIVFTGLFAGFALIL